MEIVFFGTGTSHGIPIIGCDCPVCLSPKAENKRNRTGLWVKEDDFSLMIDIASEFRLSAIKYGLKTLDAALITHSHADHISGLDDLRIFSQRSKQAFPLYGNEFTLREIKEKFSYAFRPPPAYGGGTPNFELIQMDKPYHIGPWEIEPLPVFHGPQKILGYKIGPLAFITDCSKMPEEVISKIRGIDTLILNCLRYKPHSTHFNYEQAIAHAERIAAKKTWFTHMTHELEHFETNEKLKKDSSVDIELSYDGLKLKLT